MGYGKVRLRPKEAGKRLESEFLNRVLWCCWEWGLCFFQFDVVAQWFPAKIDLISTTESNGLLSFVRGIVS